MFQRTSSTNIRFVVFALVSVFLIAVDPHQSHLKFLRTLLTTLVYPIQYVVNIPIEITEWGSTTLVTHSTLLKENERLKQERLLLSRKLQRYVVLETENQRLRELLESSFKINDKVLVAELIGVELQTFRKQVVINKGLREGAYEGQPIVGSTGIMGQIIHVGPFSSTVLLITDSDHALPVQINRNGLRAIAVGTGNNNKLLLEHLPNTADILVGDLIITSGLARRFPSGYPVGKIKKIAYIPGEAFAKVTIEPSAQLSQLREVLMVWPNEKADEINKYLDDLTTKFRQ